MKRAKKIVIVAHCVLNVNAKVNGLAKYQGAVSSLIIEYIKDGYGIIQLPCPETTFIGIQRWGMSYNQYDHSNYRNHCIKLITPYVEQIHEYQLNGYFVDTIVGVDGSPSCGINLVSLGYKGGMIDTAIHQTKDLREANRKGILMEEFERLLSNKDIQIRFNSISEKTTME